MDILAESVLLGLLELVALFGFATLTALVVLAGATRTHVRHIDRLKRRFGRAP